MWAGYVVCVIVNNTMMPTLAVPSFDGKDSFFASSGQQEILRNQIANMEPGRKAAALIFKMHHVARQECVTEEKVRAMKKDGPRGCCGFRVTVFPLILLIQFIKEMFD